MKKYIWGAFIIFASLTSCSDHGLSKPITEPLTVDELRANLEDSTFTEFYEYVQKLREWVFETDMRQAKYGDITYNRLKKFMEISQDSTFFKEKEYEWLEAYGKEYPYYKEEVDSIMNHWRSYKKQYNMDSVALIEFCGLKKEYYQQSDDVKNNEVGFLITPKYGQINYLKFRYVIVRKANNDGDKNFYGGKECLLFSQIDSPYTDYWLASDTDEKILKNKTTEEVKRLYDFKIKIDNVICNGVNYEDKLEEIPAPVAYALEYCDGKYNSYRDNIIKLLINPKHISFDEYIRPLFNAEMKEYDTKVYEFLMDFNGKDFLFK